MAEIHIERKRGASRLLWIILLLAIIAVAVYAWMTYGYQSGVSDGGANRGTTTQAPPQPAAP